MPYDLAPVYRDAIHLFGGDGTNVFNTATFQQAIKAEFQLAAVPDTTWCVEVLLKDDRIVPQEGGCHWRLIEHATPSFLRSPWR